MTSNNDGAGDQEPDIVRFQKTFARVSGALALMVAAIPAAIGWTGAIPALSDTHQKFSQVNVSVMTFSSIGLIYYYRNELSSTFVVKEKSGIIRRILIHTPAYCFILSILSSYLYFHAYESAEPNEFWPILAYSGMFVFPAVLLTIITLRDFTSGN